MMDAEKDNTTIEDIDPASEYETIPQGDDNDAK